MGAIEWKFVLGATLGAFIGSMISRKIREWRQRKSAQALAAAYKRKVNAADWLED